MKPSSDDTAAAARRKYEYAPGQPNIYLTMRLKQELVAAHGRAAAFERFKEIFELPSAATLREGVVESERTCAAAIGLVFVETAPAGRAFENPAPRLVGAGDTRALRGVTRSQYVACVPNAIVRGRSSLIETAGHLLLDVQDDEGQRFDDELEWDPSIFHAEGNRVWCIDRADATTRELDEAFTLLGSHTDFFGHWMCQHLPKFVAAALSGRFPPTVPILIDAHMPPSHREALELLYPERALIDVPAFAAVRVHKLWCAPALSYWPLHEIRNERFTWDAISADAGRFVPVVEDLQRRFDASGGSNEGAERVYLARKAFRHRKLVNSDVIERVARDLGFDVVHPEDRSFREQAALARSARIIVAPEGSAIFLAMFARPGATLCILSHPLTDLLGDYNALFGALGIDVLAVTGPIVQANTRSPNDSSYLIDDDTFRRTVEGLIGGSAGTAARTGPAATSGGEAVERHCGFCVWFTGLSGSGKSTTAGLLAERLRASGVAPVVLDGDDVRKVHSPQLGFSRADRDANVLRIGRMAADAVAGGRVAVCAAISPFAASREACRQLVGPERFVEVFVDTPLAVCESRDPKGLYARARRGEVTQMSGIDAPYESPRAPDVVLDTVASTAAQNVDRLLAYLQAQAWLK